MFLLHTLRFYEIYYNIWYTIANIVVEMYELWQEIYKNGYRFIIYITILYVRHYDKRSFDLY